MIDQPEPLDGKLLDEIDGVMQGYEHFRKDDVVRAVAWLKERIWARSAFIEHLSAKQQEELDMIISLAFVDCVKK